MARTRQTTTKRGSAPKKKSKPSGSPPAQMRLPTLPSTFHVAHIDPKFSHELAMPEMAVSGGGVVEQKSFDDMKSRPRGGRKLVQNKSMARSAVALRQKATADLQEVAKTKPKRNLWDPNVAGFALHTCIHAELEYQQWSKDRRSRGKSVFKDNDRHARDYVASAPPKWTRDEVAKEYKVHPFVAPLLEA